MTKEVSGFDYRVSRRRLIQLATTGTAMGAVAGASASAQTDAPEPRVGGTLGKVRDAGVMRVAALVGEPPYFVKDVRTGEWSGACVEMAKDIAELLDVEIEFVDSSYGNSVIQLQTDRVDIAMSLTPTPLRSLAINFSRSYFLHGYGLVAPGSAP
jgi:polar amino acid transport system substrate-binding protein